MKAQTENRARTINDIPAKYSDLCSKYLPRPLHDDADYQEAQDAILPLMGFESRLSSDQADYLEAVSTFIEQYEREHVKWPSPKPEKALRFLALEHGMSGAALARLLGMGESMGGKLLRGERRLTVEHIRILSRHFSVSPELFIG